MKKLYADRDTRKLGDHYVAHVGAMTEEGLHSKSDIAAELAWRDQRISQLEDEAERYRGALKSQADEVIELQGKLVASKAARLHATEMMHLEMTVSKAMARSLEQEESRLDAALQALRRCLKEFDHGGDSYYVSPELIAQISAVVQK